MTVFLLCPQASACLNNHSLASALGFQNTRWRTEVLLSQVTFPTVRARRAGATELALKKILDGRAIRIRCHGSEDNLIECKTEDLSRRGLIQGVTLGAFSLALAGEADAIDYPPQGYRSYKDKREGYTFYFPQNWTEVRGAGAAVFFRDATNLDENLSMNVSSPSSSRYQDVTDLGSPAEAGELVLNKYLNEFMSTRLGVQRESNVVNTRARTGVDGRQYYEIQVNVKSYANTNQLAILPEERVRRLEWNRRYYSVLGVENRRLYELRLQLPEKLVDAEQEELRVVLDSFQLITVDPTLS